MSVMTKEWYIQEARRLFEKLRGQNVKETAIEIDPDSNLSMGSNPGAWVRAWLWVPDPAFKEIKSEPHTHAGTKDESGPVCPEIPPEQP